MNKNVIAVACVSAVAATATGIVAAAGAQEPVPTVQLTVAAKSATVAGAEALKAGPTKLAFKSSGKGERGFAVFRLNPGVTRDVVTKAAPKIKTPAQAHRYGRFVASGFIEGRQTYSTTVTLPAAEYVLIDFTKQPAVRTGFTVASEQSTATPPAAVATVKMSDYRFGAPSTLPRSGVIQVDNAGKKLHHALVLPLAKGVNAQKLIADIKRGKEPADKNFKGAPAALTEVVSPGTSNAVDAKLTPGKSLLICFISDSERKPPHAALGMAKVVTVR